MMHDIASAYADPVVLKSIQELRSFPTDEFSFTCEEKMLPVHEKYQ